MGWLRVKRAKGIVLKFDATHSPEFRNYCIFFSENRSSKKFTCHSLNFSGGALIKNKGESYIFPKMPILTPFYVVFFFPEVCLFFLVFFFPEKSLNFTHSLVSNLVFFFPAPEKKIHQFYSLMLFLTKMSQM